MLWLLQLLLQFPFLALHTERGGKMVFPRPLSREEEAENFRIMKEENPEARKAARDTLIEHNLRLVSHIAGKYARGENAGRGDDLFSIGCIGLIKAIETFSSEKNIRFSSYAAKCVSNEILMYFRASRKNARDVSLSDPIESDRDGNPLTIGDLLADETDIGELIDRQLDVERLMELIRTLPPREQQLLTHRYGLFGNRPLTQQEVSRRLGISRSYVSRIEKKALLTLKEAFEKSK